MRKLWIILVTVSLCHSVTTPVLATESALTVSPAIMEAVLEASTKPTIKTVTVANTTGFPLPIKGQVGAFLTNERVEGVRSTTFNASKWFKLEPADFILQPHATQTVKVTITPPQGVEPGGHYATIFFQPLIPEGVVSANSTISLARVGILTFLVAQGDMITDLQLRELRSPQFSLSGPIELSLEFTNQGSVHVNPRGAVQIKDLFGHVESVPLPLTTILPSTTKPLSLTWDSGLKWGRFVATGEFTYDNNQKTTLLTTTFWIIPLQIILPVFIFLTIAFKLFIVGKDRIKLAIQVLRGTDNDQTSKKTH